MILHFLRHAQAENFDIERHQHDRDRALTAEGVEQIQMAAEGLSRMKLHFDQIISSPYQRAVQTAQTVANVFQFSRPVHLSENLAPDALFHRFRKEMLDLWTGFHSLLIVTHQPFVSECISCLLTGKDVPLAVDMGTSTLCSLEIDSFFKGPSILVSMITAGQAALMRGDQ